MIRLISLLHIPTAKLIYDWKDINGSSQLTNKWSFEEFNELKRDLDKYTLHPIHHMDGQLKVFCFKYKGCIELKLEHIEIIKARD